MEHNALWRPLKMLEQTGVIELTAVPCPDGGSLDPLALAGALRENTALVAVTHASNVTGALQPIPEIGEICRRAGVPLLVDAAQTAGTYPIDVEGGISACWPLRHKGLMGWGTGGLYIA